MKQPSPGPGPRHDALLDLLRTAETVWNASRVLFGRWDLSPSQFNLVNLLRHHPAGLTQSELSRELIMHRSNVTGLVDRLERRGLVERQDSATDRRAWRVVITAAGQRVINEILPDYYRATELVWRGVPAGRVRELQRVLARLTAQAGQLSQAFTPQPDRP